MNEVEARAALEAKLAEWKCLPYEELVRRIGKPETLEVETEPGSRYQVELEAFWDGKQGGNVRVIGSVDDGGMRALVLPISAGFIKACDGTVLDE